MKIKIFKAGTGLYYLPSRKHYNDAGLDIAIPKDPRMVKYVIEPGEILSIGLGFGVEIPDGFMGLVFPRSSLATKGLTCELPPIDSGYRGEIHAIITNASNETHELHPGERVGQLVILPVILADLVEDLGNERGEGAFGSTGKHAHNVN